MDVFLLYYAFKINYKSGEIFETIKIIKENLLITRNYPSGKKQTWNLEPYWTRVEILNPARHQHNLVIKSKNKVVLLGSFLNYDDKKKLITEIKPFDLNNLIEWNVVQGGMIPKIKNCVDAVENGVRGVVILDGRKPHSILHEIFSDKGAGTLIRK